MSLPANLGTVVETIPAFEHYLSAEPARIAAWRERLADAGGCKVGIAWQGSPSFTGDSYRSIPLAEYLPLAECAGVRLFSLQKYVGREQLAALGSRGGIVDLGASLDEEGSALVDTAAVMKNLDLVITSDTSIAHLAGALGVRVWVALQYKPNWRFFLERGQPVVSEHAAVSPAEVRRLAERVPRDSRRAGRLCVARRTGIVGSRDGLTAEVHCGGRRGTRRKGKGSLPRRRTLFPRCRAGGAR